ncbi:hypothetical protein [Spirulina sp. 06S082]|uniref:hypothetical protein n=1 Tax=Spirulina sp. 06S082 TaxID=3110248 RepID=UPI002B1EBB0E|nr:hypothetical protein [Spirulina sp. 06S082]MEA5469349.1 hypothetical protein [Spirulina sp. 06S082]
MLTSQAFKAWLENANHKNNIVGSSDDPANCPIANYLKDGNDYLAIEVLDCEVNIWHPGDHDPISYPLPDWAQRFINEIDGENTDPHEEVHQDWALKILTAKDIQAFVKGEE